jgi:hypothetical protein
MSNGIPVPPEIRAAIIADVRRGDSRWDVKARYGIGRSTVDSIMAAADRGVLECVGSVPLTAEQRAEIASRYEAGEKTVDLAAEFGTGEYAIRMVARAAGVIRRPARVQRPLRHDAFDVLTPEAAYWLGIFFTDGTINWRKDGQPQIALVLQERDREHLVKFRDFLGSDHAITPIPAPKRRKPNGTKGGPMSMYAVRSRPLADRLVALGRYGAAVDPELAASPHFWRGCIDGDGCIGVYSGIPSLKLFGSKWLLGAFVEFLDSAGLRRAYRGRPVNVRPHRKIFTVGTGSSTAVGITKLLYADATVALDRKAERAAQIIPMQPPFIWPCKLRLRGLIQD